MDRGSHESGNAPLQQRNYQYQQAYNNPYPQGDPKFNDSTYYSPPARKRISPWIKFGVPVLIVIVAAAVVGGILGARAANKDSKNQKGAAGDPSQPPTPSDAANAKQELGVFPTATDSYNLPVYPKTTNAAAFATPTVLGSAASAAWPTETFVPSSPDLHTPRPDRPRLIAPAYKWEALPDLIKKDAYMAKWNDTIFFNATTWRDMGVVPYAPDGGLSGSGILDVSRQVKERIKAWAYAYRLTKDQAWVERTWQELFAASGNSTESFGTAGDNWNSLHFLDVGEMTAAFAFAYDWMNDAWTDDRRQAIMWSIITLGLQKGLDSYNGASFGWWTNNINGNWNCVSNGGMIMGALAILGDDPTGIATQMLDKAIPNVQQNCAQGPSTDGTWSETANYWYFGTTGHAELVSSLMTATGSDWGILAANPSFNLTGLYHMYVQGSTSLFNYGDHGPNKYSTTANSMIFYGSIFNIPRYTLYQRDHADSAEPTGMFWYDPTVAGAWWAELDLDHYFDDPEDQWASMRATWTDNTGLYVAMKAGKALNHQTHGDLDQGDFVFDAMGQRWAGEYGSGDYLSPAYFSSETQDSQRWLYYRKMTEGQNTLMIGDENQNVNAVPTGRFGTTGEKQSVGTTVYTPPPTSKAFFVADLTQCYNNSNSVKRGIRLLNGRKQVLLQDEIDTGSDIQWRVQTNATVSINGNTATLTLGGKTLTVSLIDPPAGATFSTEQPVRLPTDPALPEGASDQPNPGVTVLAIVLPAGQYTLSTLWNPQWDGMQVSDFVTPPNVPLDSWTLDSHP